MNNYIIFGIIIILIIGFVAYYITLQKKCSKCEIGYYCDETTDYKCKFKECPVDSSFKNDKCICDFGEKDGICISTNDWLKDQFLGLNNDMIKLLELKCT